MAEESLRQKAKKGLYWKFFDTFANQGMQFVVGIVMARLLTPSDYGLTALPAIFIGIAGSLIDSGFALALIRKPDLSEKDLSTSFYYSFLMGVLMYFFLFILAPWIALFYDAPILTPLIRVTAISFILNPISTPQGVILNRRLDFKTPARISIVNKIISAIVGITIAYNGYGVWALVLSSLTASILGVIQTWIVVRWIPTEKFSKESFKYLWNFGNKILATSIIGTLYGNFVPIVVGKFFGSTDLGIYNRAYSYARLPYQQVTGTIQSVSFPVLSKLQDNNEELAKNYLRMVKTVCFAYFPIMMLLVGLARPIIIIMLTEKWEQSIILLQILCFVTISGPLSALNTNVLQVKGRSDLYLKLDVKKKTVGFIITLLTLPFGLIPFCCGYVVSQMYTVYVNLVSVGKVIPLGFRKQMKELIPEFLLSLCLLILLFFITSLTSNYWFQIIIGVTSGLLLYFGLAYFFKLNELDEFLYLIKIKKK